MQLRFNLNKSMKKAEEIFKNHLKIKNLKYTPERKILLECITNFNGHFDVETLHNKVSKIKVSSLKPVSRATIYRNIPLLIECGILKESLRQEGRVQYEADYGQKHHDHLICQKCGKIIEFTENKIEQLQNEVCKKYDFVPEKHILRISGFCKACTKTSQKENQ